MTEYSIVDPRIRQTMFTDSEGPYKSTVVKVFSTSVKTSMNPYTMLHSDTILNSKNVQFGFQSLICTFDKKLILTCFQF